MWPICNMAWRIGEILDIDAQIDWTLEAGFDGVGFHASPGAPGQWQGIDFTARDAAARGEIRERLSRFVLVEIHAPFASALADDGLDAKVEELCAVLDFAGDVGAAVVTAHASLPSDAAHWRDAMQRLDAAAGRNAAVVGLELTVGFEWVEQWALPRVGVTLDVGHMYLNHARPLEPYAGIGDVVRKLGDRLVHLHVHDYDGENDHIELGTGHVDLEGVLAALRDIGYGRGMTLEMNPDRVSPEGIRRCLAWLRVRGPA